MGKTGRLLLGVWGLLNAASAQAAFQVPFNSVRSSSLANASVAISQGAAGLFTNPAGLAALEAGEASFMYNKPYAGLNAGTELSVGLMAVGVPLPYGALGLGLGTFMASGLKQERTLGLTYGAGLFENRLQLGLTGKHLHHSYAVGGDALAANDPVFRNGTSASAIAFDAGIIATVKGPLKVGLAMRNINQPDLGLATKDRVPREIQAGLTRDWERSGWRVSGDINVRDSGSGDASDRIVPSIGAEKSLSAEKFSFRFGLSTMELAGGVGIKIHRFIFDYAVVINRNLISQNFGTHRIGITFQFGAPKDIPRYRWIKR